MSLATTGAPHERPWRLLEELLAELPFLTCARLGRRRLYTGLALPSESLRSDFDRNETNVNSLIHAEGLAVAIVASLDGSGYTREAATDALAACTTGRELPWLILRTRDWVDHVAVKASRAVAARIATLPAERLCELTALVVDLHGVEFGERPESPTWATLLAARFADVKTALVAPDALAASPEVAARVFARLHHHTPDAWLPMLRALAAGQRPLLAGRALRALENAGAVNAWLLREMRAVGLPSLSVRVAQLAATLDPEFARPWAETDLMAPRRGLREAARHVLRADPRAADWAAFYRARLPHPAAVEGLAETATTHEPHFSQWVAAPSAALRTAGVLGLGRTGGSSHLALFEALLRDPSRAVRALATRFLRIHAGKHYRPRG